MKVDELLLLTGNDIPFPKAKLIIHQPHIRDIGLIEESNFFTGCHFLLIDKNQISFEDKNGLDVQTNFDIFIAAMNSRDQAPHKVAVYSKYISILAVGLKKSMIDLSNYTIYQLRDEFKRFQLKQDFDIYIKAKLAGAQDLEEVENWMEDIHP